MIVTDKTPTEISLVKSSTGTWTAPQPVKHQLNAWQRLWLVTGAIYLLMLAGSFYLLVPDQEQIERQMIFSVTEEVKRFDGMAFAGESPRKIFAGARLHGYSTWIAQIRTRYQIGTAGNAGFGRIEKVYHDAISDLPVKRKLGLLSCFLAWMIPMSAFYAVGSGVDWIKRGNGAIQGK